MRKVLIDKAVRFNYKILDTLVCGMQLTGTEVKSLREGKASIKDAYCYVENGEMFVKNMHISEYALIKYTQHDPYRVRKLLLRKNEINKFHQSVKERGYTIVPLSIILTDSGFFKLEIGLAQGKKVYDKKATLKEKDIDRETKRELNRN